MAPKNCKQSSTPNIKRAPRLKHTAKKMKDAIEEAKAQNGDDASDEVIAQAIVEDLRISITKARHWVAHKKDVFFTANYLPHSTKIIIDPQEQQNIEFKAAIASIVEGDRIEGKMTDEVELFAWMRNNCEKFGDKCKRFRDERDDVLKRYARRACKKFGVPYVVVSSRNDEEEKCKQCSSIRYAKSEKGCLSSLEYIN